MRSTAARFGLSLGFSTLTHDVFISYSREDRLAADAACANLEAAGIRCWIAPRDISPGSEWGEAIVDAIDHSPVMVLIFSSNSNESPQIRREVERAVSKSVTIVPVRIEQVEPTRSLAYFMAGVHWLDALTPPLEQHLQRLAVSIKAFLAAVPANAPSETEQIPPTSRRATIRSHHRGKAKARIGIGGPRQEALGRKATMIGIAIAAAVFAAVLGLTWPAFSGRRPARRPRRPTAPTPPAPGDRAPTWSSRVCSETQSPARASETEPTAAAEMVVVPNSGLCRRGRTRATEADTAEESTAEPVTVKAAFAAASTMSVAVKKLRY